MRRGRAAAAVAVARAVAPTAAAATLLALATPTLPTDLRVTTVLGVAVTIGLGQAMHLPTATAVGLLAVVVGVATGPAATAGPLTLLAWVVATWGVVLTAQSRLGTPWPPPRDAPTRWRLVAGAAACVGLSLPLLVVASAVDRAGRGWPIVGGLALVTALVLMTARPGSDRGA